MTKPIPSRPLKISLFSLQAGLAFIFGYAGIDALHEPAAWIGYLPTMLTNLANPNLVLQLVSVFQIILAVALLIPQSRFYAALIAAGMLAGITIMNLGAMVIVFRDVGLTFMALALAAQTAPKWLTKFT